MELNSITKLFHPKGLIRYCKDYSKFGKKVNLDCDVLSWYLIGHGSFLEVFRQKKLSSLFLNTIILYFVH